jgi:hypothetical protein
VCGLIAAAVVVHKIHSQAEHLEARSEVLLMDFGWDVSHFVVVLLLVVVVGSRMLLRLDLDRQHQQYYRHPLVIGGQHWASSMRHVSPDSI